MNDDSKCDPLSCHDSFVQLLNYKRVFFHLLYRQTEGVVSVHAGIKIPSIPDY
jgi:hypothetical protein